jgi:hypothetical protein
MRPPIGRHIVLAYSRSVGRNGVSEPGLRHYCGALDGLIMAGKRIVAFSLAGAAVIVGIFAAASGFASGLATIGFIIFQSLFPSTISWDSKSAFAKCAGAIADSSQWPKSPGAICEAMHLCANEAIVSDRQKKLLEEAVRKTPDCPEL